MVYELRIYTMHPGRMDAILRRFRDVTLGLFPNHGIRVVDFWVDATGREVLYYICAFEDEAQKRAAWDAFEKDSAWIAAKAQSELDGPIVARVESFMMTRPDFFAAAR